MSHEKPERAACLSLLVGARIHTIVGHFVADRRFAGRVLPHFLAHDLFEICLDRLAEYLRIEVGAVNVPRLTVFVVHYVTNRDAGRCFLHRNVNTCVTLDVIRNSAEAIDMVKVFIRNAAAAATVCRVNDNTYC